MSDTELINRFRKGDPRALTSIFRMHHNALFSFAHQLVRNGQEASDIVASAFLRLWQKSYDFDSMKHVQNFLFVATHDACRSYVKAAGAAGSVIPETKGEPEPMPEDFIQSRLIRAGLFQKILEEAESLPPVKREIFNLTYVEGLNVFEIAARLRISVDSVRVQKIKALHCARAAILRKEK